jgi:AraC family transcriptional activator of pobA
MPLHFAKQQAFFNIQRLTAMRETGADNTGSEIIEIFLVVNGEVAVAGSASCVLLDNSNLYCTHGNRYCKASIKEDTEGYVIRFNKTLLYRGDAEFNCSYFSAFQALVQTGEVMRVGDPFLSEGKKLCEMMLQEFEHENDFKLQILSGYLNIFLFQLMRKLDLVICNTGNESSITLVRKFNVLLEQRFRTNKRVSDYAALLFVSPNYLNETIKQVTGKSVGILIRQRVALEAVRQVKLTGASMKEVAYDLGFNDNSHFSKFFKKAAGKNFTEIRKYFFNKTVVSFNRI